MDLADFDREAVLASFPRESEEGLDLMERVLVQMESSPSDPELVHNIFRVHTASKEMLLRCNSVNWPGCPTW